MAVIDERLLKILACPASTCDNSPLQLDGEQLVCSACQRRYPIVDGIPVLLEESAIMPEKRS